MGEDSGQENQAPTAPPDLQPRPAAPRDPEISIVAPFYNESAVIGLFFERVEQVLVQMGVTYEIVCVNDGSRDDTLTQLVAQAARNPRIKVIDLSRNFGKEQALTAGLDHATGAAVIPIDADLQDPPELIPELVTRWRAGWDVVYGRRVDRNSDSATKRMTAGGFYRLYNWMAQVKIPANTGDFRLMDQSVVRALSGLRERNRFMKGLFAWVGFRAVNVDYVRPERAAGETSWNYWKLWNFALDGITASTTVPLRFSSYLGVAISGLAFLYALVLIIRTLIFGADVPGYASTMTVILLMGGIQLTILGVIGEYLGRMYQEVKGRPVYLVRRRWNIDDGPAPGAGAS